MIDASKAYDGQGAFRNGLHDSIRLPRERRLYRAGYPWARWNHFAWWLGNKLGRLRLVRAIVVTLALGLSGCASQPTLGDASRLLAEELAKAPPRLRLVTVFDTETTVLYENGVPVQRLGECLRLEDGGREITIYVTRHGSVEQLAETIRHEVAHALLSCTEVDHEQL